MSKETLIVGAGAAGLLAAKMLAESGHLVTIIESRARAGGRIFSSNEVFSSTVEFGAEFIHGELPLTLELARDAGAEVVEQKGKWYQVKRGEISEAELFDHEWEQMLQKLDDVEKDVPLAVFMDEHFPDSDYRGLRENVKQFVEGYDAADLSKVSSLALREEWKESDDSIQFRITGGYRKIVDYLLEQIHRSGGSVLYSSRVTKVSWSRSKVTLELADGRAIKGERVIITVPLGVLQNGGIAFAPDLPFRKDTFNKIGFGGVIKFVIEFTPAFWDIVIRSKFSQLGFVLSDAEIPTWWRLEGESPILAGWWAGPDTSKAQLAEEELLEKAYRSLSYLFSCARNELDNGVVRARVVDWLNDINAQGAYAYATVSTNNARSTLTIPVEETVYFAGEALYNGPAIGTVEAALVSGRDVARRVASLRGADFPSR